jgi:hypothetical protein
MSCWSIGRYIDIPAKRGVCNLIKTIKFESQLGSSKKWIIDQYECEHKQIPFVEGKCVGK